MTTPHDSRVAPRAGQARPDSDARQPPLSSGRREIRGLIGLVAAIVVLCLLAAVAFNVVVTRSLHSPYAVPDTRGAVIAPATPPAAAPAAAIPGGNGLANAVPATPQAAADDGDAAAAPAGTGAAAATSAMAQGFVPPDARQIPDTPMGAVIRRGEQIFLQTGTNAPGFVGNHLNCVNCHLDAGRKAQSAPMWGAYPLYPAYRSKTQHVDTFSERLRGCFTYSMNGKAPDPGDEVLVALEAYAYWMAQGAPIGQKLPGAGYGKVPAPAKAPDYQRGQAVFTAQCVLCHGADGQGQRSGEVQVFPPLWGTRSYNWGAGMHEVDKAAAFIQANMPLGRGGTLNAQDAWDVSTYINSQQRPQDPRFTQDVSTTREQFHNSPYSLYGTTVNGKLLGGER